MIVIRKLVFLFFFLALYILSNAQKDSSFVDDIYFVPKKNVKDNTPHFIFCVEFDYDSLFVGKEKEVDYIKRIKDEKNEKKKGKGDKWEVNWQLDRKEIYEPAFTNGLFEKFNYNMNLGEKKKANYIIRVIPKYLDGGIGFINFLAEVNSISGEQLLTFYSGFNPLDYTPMLILGPVDKGKVTSDCYYINGKNLAKKINSALKDAK